MAAITVTGTVTKCEVRRRVDDFASGRRYAPNNEFYAIRHNICLTDADGRRFYFDGPAVRQTVANAPGCAVVVFHVDGDSGNWFRETGGSGVATAERSNTNNVESLVKVGDTITVRASVKAVKPGYTGLCRVKMVKPKAAAVA